MSDQPSFPSHIQIQTVTACGAACTICPHPQASPHWPNGLMSGPLFDRLLEQLRGRPVQALSPYLMADGMADRSLFERIARLREALPRTHLELSTTALYLTPRLAQGLLAAPLSELRLSSHGISAEEWARTMPGLRWARDWPRLEQFIALWRQRRPYPLRIVTLGGMWPAQREAEIEKFWEEQGVEIVRWEVISRAEQVDLSIFGSAGEGPPRSPDKLEPPWACRFGRDTKWLHILSDGRVTLCCMDYRHEVILGDLTNQTIDDVWTGPAMARVRAQVRGDEPTAPDFLCHRCEWHVSRSVLAERAEPAALAAPSSL